jgi:hypothetical protein
MMCAEQGLHTESSHAVVRSVRQLISLLGTGTPHKHQTAVVDKRSTRGWWSTTYPDRAMVAVVALRAKSRVTAVSVWGARNRTNKNNPQRSQTTTHAK